MATRIEIHSDRLRLRDRVSRLSNLITFHAKTAIAIGGLVLVILSEVPWLEPIFSALGLAKAPNFGQVVLLVILVAVFFDVRSLMLERKPIEQERSFYHDPMDVYPTLLLKIKATKKIEHKRIDVIGMTLYTAWPSIRFWLQRSEMTGWTISFSSLHQIDRRSNPFIPANWYRESLANLNNIGEFQRGSELHGNILRAYGYSYMPVVHGYRLGNGDLFWSVLRWGADGKICLEGYTYEYVSARDRSSAADAKREIFDSWLRRSQQNELTS